MEESKKPQKKIESITLPNERDVNKWLGIKKDTKPIDEKSNDIIVDVFKKLDIEKEDKK